MKGHFTESFDAFYKAIWNAAWQEAAYFELARLASRKRDFAKALDYIYRAAVTIVLFVIFGRKLIRDGFSRWAI